jgi:hypothetical protein
LSTGPVVGVENLPSVRWPSLRVDVTNQMSEEHLGDTSAHELMSYTSKRLSHSSLTSRKTYKTLTILHVVCRRVRERLRKLYPARRGPSKTYSQVVALLPDESLSRYQHSSSSSRDEVRSDVSPSSDRRPSGGRRRPRLAPRPQVVVVLLVDARRRRELFVVDPAVPLLGNRQLWQPPVVVLFSRVRPVLPPEPPPSFYFKQQQQQRPLLGVGRQGDGQVAGRRVPIYYNRRMGPRRIFIGTIAAEADPIGRRDPSLPDPRLRRLAHVKRHESGSVAPFIEATLPTASPMICGYLSVGSLKRTNAPRQHGSFAKAALRSCSALDFYEMRTVSIK